MGVREEGVSWAMMKELWGSDHSDGGSEGGLFSVGLAEMFMNDTPLAFAAWVLMCGCGACSGVASEEGG